MTDVLFAWEHIPAERKLVFYQGLKEHEELIIWVRNGHDEEGGTRYNIDECLMEANLNKYSCSGITYDNVKFLVRFKTKEAATKMQLMFA